MLVAITGGIGSGKSLATQTFKELGVKVLYADEIAKDIMIKNDLVRNSITNFFGSYAYNGRGEINKNHIRKEIFNDASKRDWLNHLVHPLVWENINKEYNQSTAPYIIAEIPLILDADNQDKVDKVIVVDCSTNQQVERAMRRDNLSMEQVNKIISSQISRESRLKKADFIINNSSSIESLKEQVTNLHNKLCL